MAHLEIRKYKGHLDDTVRRVRVCCQKSLRMVKIPQNDALGDDRNTSPGVGDDSTSSPCIFFFFFYYL